MQHLRGNGKKKTQMTKPERARITPEQEELEFADEYAKIAWEVGQEVSKIIDSLPPEGQNLKAQTITFDAKDRSRGTYAILFTGTVIGTDHKGAYLVPERSLNVLRQLGIPYHAI